MRAALARYPWTSALATAVAITASASMGCGDTPDAGDDGVGLVQGALSASNAADRAALALRWAPVHHQDVDQTGAHGIGGAADYITRVDFDGDFEARNDWENAGRFPFTAYAYSSVVETSTHWFIVYMFFHPRDWTDTVFDTEHENDAEGVLLAVARDGSTYGALQAAVTVAHTDFFSFLPGGSPLTAGAESVDGTLTLTTWDGAGHPTTAQQAKGHGLKAWPYYQIDGDGVIYFPSASTAEVPSGPNDRSVLYRLVDLFAAGGLWERRSSTTLFSSFGSFAGDTGGSCGDFPFICSTNSANAPWGWDDTNDGPARGTLATDPALLISNYFRVPGAFSRTYTFNPYQGVGAAAAVAAN